MKHMTGARCQVPERVGGGTRPPARPPGWGRSGGPPIISRWNASSPRSLLAARKASFSFPSSSKGGLALSSFWSQQEGTGLARPSAASANCQRRAGNPLLFCSGGALLNMLGIVTITGKAEAKSRGSPSVTGGANAFFPPTGVCVGAPRVSGWRLTGVYCSQRADTLIRTAFSLAQYDEQTFACAGIFLTVLRGRPWILFC